MPTVPDPIRYAQLRAAREWRIPPHEWDGMPLLSKMEMMAHVDVDEVIQRFIRWQRDKYQRDKRRAAHKLKGGR